MDQAQVLSGDTEILSLSGTLGVDEEGRGYANPDGPQQQKREPVAPPFFVTDSGVLTACR